MKEKIIQFGEGGFLRGFADWMIQIANEKAGFDGKVVVVQPIEQGMCDMLSAQNCVYTHVIRGVEGVDKTIVDVISRCVKPYEDFDAYLWAYRDSTGNGCLENWCIWDVGEDNSTVYMLNGLKMPEHGPWGKSTPPEDYMNMPYKSPQYMGYSYACRNVLARISEILDNGLAEKWEEKAKKSCMLFNQGVNENFVLITTNSTFIKEPFQNVLNSIQGEK